MERCGGIVYILGEGGEEVRRIHLAWSRMGLETMPGATTVMSWGV